MFIYIIRNCINQKVYVGKTEMKLVEMRWKEHRNKLRTGKHCNVHLQRAYNQYGSHNFSYEVIYETDDVVLLNHMETVFIYSFKSYSKNGYNMTMGGEGSKGLKIKRTPKFGVENSFYGKHHSAQTKKILAEYAKNRMTPEHIEKMQNGRSMIKTEDHLVKMKIASKLPRSAETKDRMSKAKTQYWQNIMITGRELPMTEREYPELLSPDGILFGKGTNLVEFGRIHGLNHKHLWSVIKGKRKSHKGWKLANATTLNVSL